MIEYRLFCDGSGICATREGERISDRVLIRLTGDTSAARIGIISDARPERFFNLNNGESEISSDSFGEGENRVTVYGKSRRWKCEPVVRTGDTLLPAGVDSAEQLMLFKAEYERICARLTLCESRLHALEEKVNQKALF